MNSDLSTELCIQALRYSGRSFINPSVLYADRQARGGSGGWELVETGQAACSVFSGATDLWWKSSNEAKTTMEHMGYWGKPPSLNGVLNLHQQRNQVRDVLTTLPLHKGHNYTCALACRKWEEGSRGNVKPFSYCQTYTVMCYMFLKPSVRNVTSEFIIG